MVRGKASSPFSATQIWLVLLLVLEQPCANRLVQDAPTPSTLPLITKPLQEVTICILFIWVWFGFGLVSQWLGTEPKTYSC